MKKLLALLALSLSVATGHVLAANSFVEMQTSAGKITIELYPEKAPKTVENFLQYVKDDFYKGTIFHRVIAGFMIQGGGFTSKMEQKETREGIVNEANNELKNQRGTLAMARRGEPNSATAQFFINLTDNPALDYPKPDGYGYAVFGKVTQGIDIVDRIARVKTENKGMHQNVPATPVLIHAITVINSK